MACCKNHFTYTFFISVLFLSGNSYAQNCGTSGFVKERVTDCNESFDQNFDLLSSSESKQAWYDKNTNLAWYNPNHGALEASSYHEIKKVCKKPYKVPKLSQVKQLANYTGLPFKLKRDTIVLKRRASNRFNSDTVDKFTHYYHLKEKKSKRNKVRKKAKDLYTILCVADLEDYFIFKRGQ